MAAGTPRMTPWTSTARPCLGRSPAPGVPSNPNFHVLHHIDDRDRYVIGGCVDDFWLAVSALEALVPSVAGHVACLGISFSGGIGALAAPWDARIRCLAVEVPTFGHQALRLTLPCTGSGEAVRIYERRRAFHVMDTLAYYDAAVSAGFLKIPTLVAAALFDPSVPPPGQFAIHNAVPHDLRRLHVLQAGHFDYPQRLAQQRELEHAVARFVMQTT
jgi:cephalosporin-C deacetylase